MHTSGGRFGRIVVGLVTSLGVVAAAGVPVASGEARAAVEVPVVSIVPESTFLISETFRDCDGTGYEVGTYGAVLLERTGGEAGGVAEFEVPVSYGGSLAGSLIAPQSTASFDDPGWAEAEIYIELPDATPGTVTITLDPPEDGAGYALGIDPEDTTIELTVPGEENVTDCADPIGVDAERTEQTIRVGEQPEPLGIFDFDLCPPDDCVIEECDEDSCPEIGTVSPAVALSAKMSSRHRADDEEDDDLFDELWEIYSTQVIGALPPGLDYADDTWTGAATTPGVYDFDVRLCIDLSLVVDRSAPTGPLVRARAMEDLPSPLCMGTEAVRIEVLPALPAPGPDAPPATPIRTQARFTG